MGRPSKHKSPHLSCAEQPALLPYHKWWHSELGLPLIKAVNLGSLNGASEWVLPTVAGDRKVCRVECLPKRKRKQDDDTKDLRWADVITGRVFAPDDPMILGGPKRTNQIVKPVASRMAEAKSRAMTPNFVTTDQGE